MIRLALSIAVLAGATAAPVRAQGTAPDASVVRVLCTTPVRAVTGSGLVVGPRRVLTSQRVVACAGQGGQVSVGVAAGRVVGASADWTSPARDLALLTTVAEVGRPVARLASAAATDGSDVRAVGFPGPGTLDVSDRLRDAAFIASILPGVVTGTAREGGTRVHDTDAALTPGLRGAPVVNACGDVVGLVGEVGGSGGARLRVLARDAVADAVQAQRLPVAVAPAPCTPPGASPTADTPGTVTDRAEIPSWLWAVSLGVLLAGLLPLLARGRRRTIMADAPRPVIPSAPVPSPPAPLARASPEWQLVGQPGLLGGTTVVVHERVRVGRDAATCELVVPAAAGAVSKRHAAIWLDGGSVWIQDASSNGTFVDGRRLDAHRPEVLREGALITFATPDVGVRLVRG